MKRITLFTLSILCALSMVSCSDDNEDSYGEATMLVSVDKLDYSKDGGTQTFTITVNQKNNYIAQWVNPIDWGKISEDGSTVTVVIEPNATPDTRVAKILVYSLNGGLKEYVTITQTATGLIFDVVPGEIEFTRLGGEKTVQVKSNATDWTIDGGAEWFSTEIKPALGEIMIVAQANAGEIARKAFFTIKRGSETKQIAIIQQGTNELVLPYMNFGSSLQEVINFETKRGNIYKFTPETTYEHQIKTLSLSMPMINLEFSSDYYIKAIVRNTLKLSETEAIAAFYVAYGEMLVKAGFNKETETDFSIEAPSGRADVFVKLYGDGVIFDIVEKQAGPMPTFAEFPYGFITWGADEAEVAAYETTIGGVLDTEQSDGKKTLVYMPKAGDPIYAIRGYMFASEVYVGLKETSVNILGLDRMFYLDMHKVPRLTREYAALLVKEGFKHYWTDLGSGEIYYTKTSRPGHSLLVVHEVFDASNFVSINMWEGSFETNSMIPTRASVQDKLKQKARPAGVFTPYRVKHMYNK